MRCTLCPSFPSLICYLIALTLLCTHMPIWLTQDAVCNTHVTPLQPPITLFSFTPMSQTLQSLHLTCSLAVRSTPLHLLPSTPALSHLRSMHCTVLHYELTQGQDRVQRCQASELQGQITIQVSYCTTLTLLFVSIEQSRQWRINRATWNGVNYPCRIEQIRSEQ